MQLLSNVDLQTLTGLTIKIIVTRAMSYHIKCILSLMRQWVELPGVPLVFPDKPTEPVTGPLCVYVHLGDVGV